jgi:hypothetical protein
VEFPKRKLVDLTIAARSVKVRGHPMVGERRCEEKLNFMANAAQDGERVPANRRAMELPRVWNKGKACG